jgi:hypothetical protein
MGKKRLSICCFNNFLPLAAKRKKKKEEINGKTKITSRRPSTVVNYTPTAISMSSQFLLWVSNGLQFKISCVIPPL